jgi:hypothetical protein
MNRNPDDARNEESDPDGAFAAHLAEIDNLGGPHAVCPAEVEDVERVEPCGICDEPIILGEHKYRPDPISGDYVCEECRESGYAETRDTVETPEPVATHWTDRANMPGSGVRSFPVNAQLPVEPSALDAAWSEADRLTSIACDKARLAVRADSEWKEADLASLHAWDAAEAIGPRPTKVQP